MVPDYFVHPAIMAFLGVCPMGCASNTGEHSQQDQISLVKMIKYIGFLCIPKVLSTMVPRSSSHLVLGFRVGYGAPIRQSSDQPRKEKGNAPAGQTCVIFLGPLASVALHLDRVGASDRRSPPTQI